MDSDLDQLLGMLRRAGVPFSRHEGAVGAAVFVTDATGYAEQEVRFRFARAGNLVDVRSWHVDTDDDERYRGL